MDERNASHPAATGDASTVGPMPHPASVPTGKPLQLDGRPGLGPKRSFVSRLWRRLTLAGVYWAVIFAVSSMLIFVGSASINGQLGSQPWMVGAVGLGLLIGIPLAAILSAIIAIVVIWLGKASCYVVGSQPRELEFAKACGAVIGGLGILQGAVMLQAVGFGIAPLMLAQLVVTALANFLFHQWQASFAALKELRGTRDHSPMGFPHFSVWQLLGTTTLAALVFTFGRLLGSFVVPVAIGLVVVVVLHLSTRSFTARLANRWLDRRARRNREKRLAAGRSM